jgi:hypothetical protein
VQLSPKGVVPAAEPLELLELLELEVVLPELPLEPPDEVDWPDELDDDWPSSEEHAAMAREPMLKTAMPNERETRRIVCMRCAPFT